MARRRWIVGLMLIVVGCWAIESMAQRGSRRSRRQDQNQADQNQGDQERKEEQQPEAKLPDDPKLLEVYETFVLNAEKLAADYAKNDQFDEDIKYTVFSDDDKDRMSPEEYAKYQEVKARQMELREETLKRKAAERQQRQHAKR